MDFFAAITAITAPADVSASEIVIGEREVTYGTSSYSWCTIA